MTHTPIDIPALEALYQEVRTSSYPYVHGDRRWELLQHFPELIKAAKERDELRGLLNANEDSHREAVATAASLRALLAEAGEAMKPLEREGEYVGDPAVFKGVFDMTVSLDQVRFARSVSAAIQTALRDASPTMGKPE